MYTFSYRFFQKIMICMLLFNTTTALYTAHHLSHLPAKKTNNSVFIIVEKSRSSEKLIPSITVKYSTNVICTSHPNNPCYCQPYLTETIKPLNQFQEFNSLTVAKSKDSQISSIIFLGCNSKEKEREISVNDYDTLLISDLNNGSISIRRKNGITNQIVEVAQFQLRSNNKHS